MASTSNKPPFHTYENAGFEDNNVKNVDCTSNGHNDATIDCHQSENGSQYQIPTFASSSISSSTSSTTFSNPGSISSIPNITTANNEVSVKAATTTIESPFTDPMLKSKDSLQAIPVTAAAANILSTSDSSGNHNLVTKLTSLQAQSPMDSFKEWSLNTFKCTKQLINEKRGIYSVTNDAQLEADIETLKDNRNKLSQVLRTVQQMNNHYISLVKTQRNLHSLMNDMANKSCTVSNNISNNNHKQGKSKGNRHIVANFSCLSNNLSSSTFTTGQRDEAQSSSETLNDFLPILNHMKSSSLNLSDDFTKNAMALNSTIKNGEKLISALNFFSSNLSTLINKTVEDTIITIKHLQSARLEFDAERNSIYYTSSAQKQSSINEHNDRLELARSRYEQLKVDVQIKMKFLEENTAKVMHKQLILFHSAFASYSTGNTAALDATLKQFSIR